MRPAKLIALSGVVLSLSVGYGPEADALVNGDVTEARKAVGTVMIVTNESIRSTFLRASFSSTLPPR